MYCESKSLLKKIFTKVDSMRMLSRDVDIALFAKLGHDILFDYHLLDQRLNSKVKRLLIRKSPSDLKAFLESDTILQFMRGLKES